MTSSLAASMTRQEGRTVALFFASRTAILAVVAAGVVSGGSLSHAQSPDPAKLLQIEQQINAKAAANTWNYIPGGPPPPALASVPSQAPAQSDLSSGFFGSLGNSTPSAGPGFADVTSPSSGDDTGTNSGTTVSSTISSPNPPAGVAQPSTQDPAAQATTGKTPADPSLTDCAVPTPSPTPTTKARPATVAYDAGLLTIHADNSSLNLILRQVGHLTGITITGGVADERVFGDYGPSKPSEIVSTLLQGTGSNVVLREGPHSTITDISLTPCHGGAVPPGPNAAVWGPDEDQSNSK